MERVHDRHPGNRRRTRERDRRDHSRSSIGVAILAGIVGIAGGIYLAEFCAEGRGAILRGASEVLSGVPSIVLGYVGYVTLVVEFHWGYSLGAALIVLSVLVVPYMTKTTEVAIQKRADELSRRRRGSRVERAATF